MSKSSIHLALWVLCFGATTPASAQHSILWCFSKHAGTGTAYSTPLHYVEIRRASRAAMQERLAEQLLSVLLEHRRDVTDAQCYLNDSRSAAGVTRDRVVRDHTSRHPPSAALPKSVRDERWMQTTRVLAGGPPREVIEGRRHVHTPKF